MSCYMMDIRQTGTIIQVNPRLRCVLARPKQSSYRSESPGLCGVERAVTYTNYTVSQGCQIRIPSEEDSCVKHGLPSLIHP